MELVPSEVGRSCPNFLIFHGYGADAEDLLFLQALYPKARWFFPTAFLNHKGIPSWFNGDTEEYIQSLQKNQILEDGQPFQTNGRC